MRGNNGWEDAKNSHLRAEETKETDVGIMIVSNFYGEAIGCD
jgi:hypothetical protein